ncbi:hypothetical protein ElyMa_005171700 [Elysia marginata]|uniref:Uncharacterized protein n=1 Tax=Elysia marginata TaxID=1093978 RepID=A0AAV4JQM1_9GAST|nr:hypothetical protein ElyMa_005171700 [Elysia marginata]
MTLTSQKDLDLIRDKCREPRRMEFLHRGDKKRSSQSCAVRRPYKRAAIDDIHDVVKMKNDIVASLTMRSVNRCIKRPNGDASEQQSPWLLNRPAASCSLSTLKSPQRRTAQE